MTRSARHPTISVSCGSSTGVGSVGRESRSTQETRGYSVEEMRQTAIYPGSFDPLTNGHMAIIQRGLKVFDRLIVAVASNRAKTPLFTSDERRALITQAMNGDVRVEVDSFEGLLVEYCKRKASTPSSAG